MSNNSGVTPEGLEMGRAQIVQAQAARIAPHVDMNPILLKPTSDVGSQVVLLGKAIENSTAAEYHRRKNRLFSEACAALDRLRNQYDLIIIEGAGSCAEVNLMPHDIVNFKMAEYADATVLLVADIHRGGVFAQIVGTLACLERDQQKRVAGTLINRFRGDISLFADGVRWIEEKTAKPVFGVHPWYSHFSIESEDSVVIENPVRVTGESIVEPAVAVVRIPHISNFTDFDPLSNLPGLNLYFLEKPQPLNRFKAVILPGSKNTRYDLNWLKESGWAAEISQFSRNGGHVLGVCGGFQMMGSFVHDPHGLEGSPGSTPGLNMLPVETTLEAPKTTTLTRFIWGDVTGSGYEIHMGRTVRRSGQLLFKVIEQNGTACTKEDGCMSMDTNSLGTYIHGLFDEPAVMGRWLSMIGLGQIEMPHLPGPDARDRDFDKLATHFEAHVNIGKLSKTCLIPF